MPYAKSLSSSRLGAEEVPASCARGERARWRSGRSVARATGRLRGAWAGSVTRGRAAHLLDARHVEELAEDEHALVLERLGDERRARRALGRLGEQAELLQRRGTVRVAHDHALPRCEPVRSASAAGVSASRPPRITVLVRRAASGRSSEVKQVAGGGLRVVLRRLSSRAECAKQILRRFFLRGPYLRVAA